MNEELADQLKEFCVNNYIPVEHYKRLFNLFELHKNEDQIYTIPERYFTVAPNKEKIAVEAELRSLFGDLLKPVMFGFYSVPGHVKLANLDMYKRGDILCMDIASALAVKALDLKPGETVMDLCCAPGTKLTLMNYMVSDKTSGPKKIAGNVTGVDISHHRLCTCRSLLKKYKADKVRLFLADGCTFNIGPITDETKFREKGEKNNKEIFYASKLYRNLQVSYGIYDKVLVDAECTHDGSISHVLKVINNSSNDNFLKRDITALTDLQFSLLRNGFRLLRPGGTLIYSTCSFSAKQNELTVKRLLDSEKDAYLVEIEDMPVSDNEFEEIVLQNLKDLNITDDLLLKCKRYHGYYVEWKNIKVWTSGFFIAKIKKREQI